MAVKSSLRCLFALVSEACPALAFSLYINYKSVHQYLELHKSWLCAYEVLCREWIVEVFKYSREKIKKRKMKGNILIFAYKRCEICLPAFLKKAEAWRSYAKCRKINKWIKKKKNHFKKKNCLYIWTEKNS